VRIGLVCPYPWDVPGGVMAHVRGLALELISRGHDVGVLAPVNEADPVLEPWVTDAGKPMPIPYNGSVARVMLGPVSATRSRRWLRDGDWDVVHIHEPMSPSISMSTLLQVDRPVVATFHTSNVRSRAMAAFEPLLLSGLEKIAVRIAVSPAARRTVVEHLGGDAILIPNGVSLAAYTHAEPLPSRGPVVAFVGRIDEPRKGLAVLLEAWAAVTAAVPGVVLRIAGPGEPPEDLPPGVELLGLVDEETKARLLRGATVFAAPNLGGESFGIVLLEAMAAGAPVVASDLDAFRAVLDAGRSGLLTPAGDAPALARALVALLGDAAGRNRLSAAGLVRAGEFDWATVADRIVAVYVAAGERATAP
jgi:phosphatidylinositol alpha-mannosyltransferase